MTQEEWKESLYRRLEHLEKAIDNLTSRLTVVETKNAVDEVHRVNVEKRLASIEGTLRWLVRLIIGALILALVAFLVSGGFYVP